MNALSLSIVFSLVVLTTAIDAGQDRLIKFVAEARPFGVLSSAHGDALRISSVTGSETSDSKQSVVSSALVGVVFDTPILDVELKVGAGAMVNQSFYGGFYHFDLSLLAEVDRFRVGPHIGILTFDSVHWTGDADVRLDNNAGWLGGMLVEFKRETIDWVVALDYYDCEIDLKPGLGWVTNHSQLELSGAMIQIGFKRRF